MSPQRRKLRLRKITLRSLTPDRAIQVKAGAVKPGEDPSEAFYCTWICTLGCTDTCTCDADCVTRANTGCEYCPPPLESRDCYSHAVDCTNLSDCESLCDLCPH